MNVKKMIKITNKHGKKISLNSDFPFPIYKTPFFYGWIILIFGSIGFLLSIPGQTVGISPYTDALITALGISRANLSLAYFFGTMSSAIVLITTGKIYDIFGDRITGTLVCFIFGGVLILLSYIETVHKLITSCFPLLLPETTAFFLMILAFFSIRLLGQGLITLVSRNMIMKWFDARRGFANGILGTCITLGLSCSPRLLNDLIEVMTWQNSWRFLGQIISIVGGISFFLIARDTPQQCGLMPDGTHKPKSETDVDQKLATIDYTLKQAQKSYAFWIFVITNAMFGLCLTGIAFHIVNIFENAGMNRIQAFAIFLPAAVIALILNFTVSWLSDHIKLKYILQAELVGLIITNFSLIFLAPGYPTWLLIVGMGLIQGMFGVLSTIVWPKFYGLKHLGAISGFAMGFLVAGSAIGPYFFSLSKTLMSSYN
jgi:MFS transporter, OFA family, oxalate/formate antiporter